MELLEVGVPVFDLETCRENYLESWHNMAITNDTFCAGARGMDSCYVGYYAVIRPIGYNCDHNSTYPY